MRCKAGTGEDHESPQVIVRGPRGSDYDNAEVKRLPREDPHLGLAMTTDSNVKLDLIHERFDHPRSASHLEPCSHQLSIYGYVSHSKQARDTVVIINHRVDAGLLLRHQSDRDEQ